MNASPLTSSRVAKHVLLGLLLGLLLGCESRTGLKPFSSDGCSLFPDSSTLTKTDWCDCCFEHDIAYWQGGTQQQRETADQQLRQCVLDRTNDQNLANLMYQGVRAGGSPYFYNWYRWGYGWPYERKYQSLTAEEQTLADELLSQYRRSGGTPTCRQ